MDSCITHVKAQGPCWTHITQLRLKDPLGPVARAKKKRAMGYGYGLRVRGFTISAVISAEKVFKAVRLLYHSI